MAFGGPAVQRTINIVYKDKLCYRTRCRLVTEAIKYLLYERHQIPFPYGQVKMSLIRKETPTNPSGSAEDNIRRKPFLTRAFRREAKTRELIENFDELFSNLEVVFQSTRVFNVCLMFGPTQVSSKESFTFHFQSVLNSDCDLKCSDRTIGPLCRKLIRSLVANEEIANMKEISPTSMFIAVQSHKDDSVNWFLPKRTFKPPHRGQLYNICILTSSSESDITDEAQKRFQNEDLLWFQAPVPIKGLKETKKAEETSLMF